MARRHSRAGDRLNAIRAAGLTIADLATTEADLEEGFLRLTGSGHEAGAE